MSVEGALNFIKRMAEDESFKQAFRNAGDETSRRKLVADNGYNFTDDEYNRAVGLIAKAREADGELSDDDLEQVAGGAGLFNFNSLMDLLKPKPGRPNLGPGTPQAAYGAVWSGGSIFK